MLGFGHYTDDDTASALKQRDYKDATDLVVTNIGNITKVRRLTPLESERLQGYPDDHTKWVADGKQQTSITRYKQCGNGVATPVARWVASKITQLLERCNNDI